MTTPIYMDYNATAPIRNSVIEAVTSAMQLVGNPSSVHTAGRGARKLVEEARTKVAALVGSRARDVTFCSGGTEANNTAIRGAGAASVIVSATEHDSGLAAAKLAGVPAFVCSVGSDGLVNQNELRSLLAEAPAPALVSVMLANNETGVIQPMQEIARIVHEYGARLHTDAVQAAGKISIDFSALGADYLTLSSHKIGGPQGVGAIVTAPGSPLAPLIAGGGQELGRRSGTENVASIAGFGVAALEAMDELGDAPRIEAMRDRFETAVSDHSNTACIIGQAAPRTPNTSCIVMPSVKGETQVMHFDLNGICLSSGSACSSGKVKVSHVLSAMSYDDETANASLRVSLGRMTQESDIDALIKAWRSLYDRTSGRSSL